MAEYTELIKALRWCADESICCDDFNGEKCPYYDVRDSCTTDAVLHDAADAIEALQAENTDIREELFISQRKYDEFTMIASVQNAMLAKQLPKRGEWIVREVDIPGEIHPAAFRCMCSMCLNEYVFPRIPQYCPDCGSMNTEKMEVQE